MLKRIKNEIYIIKDGVKIIITKENIEELTDISGNVSDIRGNVDTIPMDERIKEDFQLKDWIED